MAGSTQRGRLRAHRAVTALVFACLVTSCAGGGGEPSPSPTTPSPVPVQVTVDGRPYTVAAGTTVGALLQAEGLHLRSGRLLDVEGLVLQADADPGKVKVDGK